MELATITIFPRNPSHLMLSGRLVSELGHPHSTLRATTQRTGGAVMIRAGGEVDAYNEATWRLLLAEAAAAVSPPGSLIVDVSDMEFMGCCAFAALAEEAAACRGRDIGVRLVSHDPIIRRIVAACGLTTLLPVDASVDCVPSAANGEY